MRCHTDCFHCHKPDCDVEQTREERARQRAREWYWAHRERALESRRQYRKTHAEDCRLDSRRRSKAYYAKHREDILAKKRQYYQFKKEVLNHEHSNH